MRGKQQASSSSTALSASSFLLLPPSLIAHLPWASCCNRAGRTEAARLCCLARSACVFGVVWVCRGVRSGACNKIMMPCSLLLSFLARYDHTPTTHNYTTTAQATNPRWAWHDSEGVDAVSGASYSNRSHPPFSPLATHSHTGIVSLPFAILGCAPRSPQPRPRPL